MSSCTSPKPSPKNPYTGPTSTFTHPQLGTLTGRLLTSPHFPNNATVQFRSIPYATIPKRFLPAIPLTTIPTSFDNRPHRDFTNFGAACPQLGALDPAWCSPYGGPLEDDLLLEFDELTCLSVTISVPHVHLSLRQAERKLLPVMVYVHGGGAQDGTGHVDGLHSNAPLTSFAASISQPVITVNVGYRLNWLGNLACQDLVEEFSSSGSSRSPQGPFNLSLQDQRAAFLWIQNFIAGFGGDPHSITAFGESAGSIFLAYHICGSPMRLFDRAILQSGLPIGNIPLETKDQEYRELLNHFNIKGATATERLDALRQVSIDELIKCPGSHLSPYIGPVAGVAVEDSLFSRGPPTVTNHAHLIASCEWLGDLIIGDDFWEGHVFAPLVLHCPPRSFIELVKSLFPTQHAEALLNAYDLPSSGAVENVRALIPISHFYGDMVFSGQYHTLARVLAAQETHSRKVYRYSYALSNPFPGSMCSFSPGHHFVEILFVFLTLLDRYPTHRQNWAARQAKETARRWITFANGGEPWQPYTFSTQPGNDNDSLIAVCDDLRGWTVRTVEEDERVSRDDPWGERRYHAWRALEATFGALKSDQESLGAFNDKVTAVKLKLLQLLYGTQSIIRLPGQEARS